jgi:hypothetical protein
MDYAKLIAEKRASRQALGLNVRCDGEVLSFATTESRDEFMARAKRLGHAAEVVQ